MLPTWNFPKWMIPTTLLLLTILTPTSCQETFTNAACRAQTSAMNACAKRWDSIRTECTKAVSTNTIWPGPCECAYYANDMPCFDEQEFCAAQVWTQVPQWFRDGVTSCLMKDAGFTVRAQLGSALGSMGNPFTVQGLAGKATRTASLSSVLATSAAVTGGSARLPSATGLPDQDLAPQSQEQMSVAAKAGFGIGISAGVILTGLSAFFFTRYRRKKELLSDAEAKSGKELGMSELHDDDAKIYQIGGKEVGGNEMLGCVQMRHELAVENSRRGSRG